MRRLMRIKVLAVQGVDFRIVVTRNECLDEPLLAGLARNGLAEMKVRVITLALCSLTSVFGAKESSKSEALVEKPPLPEITELQLQPSSLTLEDGRDARRVLVWGKTADGQQVDL